MISFGIRAQPASYDIRSEKSDRRDGRFEEAVKALSGRVRRSCSGKKSLNRMVALIEEKGSELTPLTDQQLQGESISVRQRLRLNGLDVTDDVISAFAVIREVSTRVLGMRHYPNQVLGGLVLLKGKIAEMDTGEGKTLTATLAAATAGLAGVPVHVISVNDYLTARDADNMGPLYRALGLRVGCVVHGQNSTEKRTEYKCDITYVTNKELVFDYLRDRLTLADRDDAILLQAEYLHSLEQRSKKLLLRGLHFAIVDEADSILIDEARTPLIISGATGKGEEQQFYKEALELARDLREGEDFILDRAGRIVRMAEQGRRNVEVRAQALGPMWNGVVRRESTIQKALMALYFFDRDKQYLVRDGKIEIIDEFTGRVMADRSWEQGLHQLIELKEDCTLTRKRETLAKISYQRFFRRYWHLCGMTGTAREVAAEMGFVYGLAVVKVPNNRPVLRKKMPDRIYPTRELKWLAVVGRIRDLHSQGRPLLVGTRSVAASEELSRLVQQAGLVHRVLNARQDAEEADIISRAGAKGAITIATNMAGRGTDIRLEEEVEELGGLHVIITERHEAARIDRQLAGRCGRQGGPGGHEAILSFEDYLLEGRQKKPSTLVVQKIGGRFSLIGRLLSRWLMKRIQKDVERYHARVRRELFHQDLNQGNLLSFTGRQE